MIAGLIGPFPSSAIEGRLSSLMHGGGSAVQQAAPVQVGIGAGIAALGGPTGGQLEPTRRIAWTGTATAPQSLADPPHRVQRDCSMIALAGPDELRLARGPFGGQPYNHPREKLTASRLVCSRLEPLVRALGNARPSPEWLSAYVTLQFLRDRRRTPYDEIFRVPSASVLRIGASGVRECDDLSFDALPHRSAPIATLADELRERILGAVSRATAGAPEVAVLVSGGLDSSGILAAALKVSKGRGQRVQVFTLDFAWSG